MSIWQRWRKWERRRIPRHLARLYPSDMSLFLLNVALFLQAWTFSMVPALLLSGVAGGSALLLLHGWLADRPDLTIGGATIASVVWTVAFFYILGGASIPPLTVAASLVAVLASLNLSLGLAWVVTEEVT